MFKALIAALGLLALACSSSPSSTASVAQPTEERVLPAASSDSDAAALDVVPSKALHDDASAAVDRFAVSNAGVGLLQDDMEASEETLVALFAGCTAKWQRHKGKATPHFQVNCDGVHVIDVVLSAQGRAGAIDYVRVYAEGIGTPSGLGVGSSYRALADLTDNLVCRGIQGGTGGPGVIVRDHTLCMSPLFPRVAYVFKGVVFNTRETPAGAEELRIDEIRWSP